MQNSTSSNLENTTPFKTANTLKDSYINKGAKLNTKNSNPGQNSPEMCGPMGKNRTPQGGHTSGGDFVPDQFDIEILKLLKLKHHGRNIARLLNRAPSTVKSRLDKMERLGAIQSGKGAFNTKIYTISSNTNRFLIHNEGGAPHPVFTAHCMEFKFPILEGSQPTNKQGYNMRNWRGYVWRFGDYVIRSTPRNIIVSVNLDLGAATIDDLILKYSDVSRTAAFDFAGKYNLVLGAPTLNRPPHYTMKDQALSQLATLRGEFKTESGLMLDKSKSSGDLEMQEKQARALEFTLNSMPELVGELVNNYESLQEQINTLTDTLNQVLLLCQVQDLRAKSNNNNNQGSDLHELQAQINDLYEKNNDFNNRLLALEGQNIHNKNDNNKDTMFS